MNPRYLYLALAVIGAVVPYWFFIRHFGTAGFGPGDFLRAVFANDAASGFTADLLIASLVFWIAMFREQRIARGPSPWPFVLLNLLIGLSCALPAWLYARSAPARAD